MKNKIFVFLPVVGTALLGLVTLSTFAGSMPNVMMPTPPGVYLHISTSPSGQPTGGYTGNPAVSFDTGTNYLYIVNGNKQPKPNDPSTYMCRVKLNAIFPKGCTNGGTHYNRGGPKSSSKVACGPNGGGPGNMGLQIISGGGTNGQQKGGSGCSQAVSFNHTSNGTGPFFLVSVPGIPK